MKTMREHGEIPDSMGRRALELFRQQLDDIRQHTDRMFAWLLGIQWLAGILGAVLISPRAWEGLSSHTHIHVWAAVFLGGAISGFPMFLAARHPGTTLTRHVVAVAQMLTSALFIHLSGGRIETHFHIFGSLAFLAMYQDWRVLLTGTIVVALDHALRGIFWPQSVFGVLLASPWRWLEHAAWVLFEDAFLMLSIRRSLRSMFGVAERQAKLERINEIVEQRVVERTQELRCEVAERQKAQSQLVDASRKAGMAEVATSVLHNVGNVLNSVSVSATLVLDTVAESKINGVSRLAALIGGHRHNLSEFFSTNPKASRVPEYLDHLAAELVRENQRLVSESQSMRKNVEHIRDIVMMQQSYAKFSGVTEKINPAELIDDALRLNDAALVRHDVRVIRDIAPGISEFTAEKNKILQILVNLIQNAKYACDASAQTDKSITIQLRNGNDHVRFSVTDNGVGIPPENLNRIFNHGFTTRKHGHGFGLHSGALAAREMGGGLVAHSDGPGTGARFTLELPVKPRGTP